MAHGIRLWIDFCARRLTGARELNKLLLAGLLIVVTLAARAATYTCQIDHSTMYATGRTQLDSVTGKLLSEYKCLQGHTVWLAPESPNTATAPAPVQPSPYAQQFADNIKRSQDQVSQAGQGLGQLLGGAIQGKQITKLSVILKCNHYHLVEISYADGSIKIIDDPRAPSGRNEVVDRDRLNVMSSKVRGFSWAEVACDE
jgi:hypothetical protein